MGLAVTGADQLADVGRKLSAAGPRLRARMRRNIIIATAPITSEAKSGWQGYGHLGAALAAATTTSVRTAGRSVGVSVQVRGDRLPEGKQGLPPLVEGLAPWKHPLWGNRSHWYAQAPRPELTPAFDRHLPGVQVGVIEAVDETTRALAIGSA
jgi:hypothetical protein